MTNLEVIGIIALMVIIIGGGAILYLALAGTAIIYSLGANESPKGRRVFFGILGVAMIVAIAFYRSVSTGHMDFQNRRKPLPRTFPGP